MVDGTDAAAAAAATAAAAAAATNNATPWHTGMDAEIIGHIQNKGWKLDDPKAVVIEAVKAHRGVQSLVGAPPERMLLLPEKPTDEAGWKGVYGRLGVPAEAKDYDLAGIKRANGADVEAALADTLRGALLAGRVPKDRAADVVKAVVGHLDNAEAAAKTEQTAKLAEEKATLKKNWGNNYDFNQLKAMEGIRRLGFDKDTPGDIQALNALENVIGHARIMEMFRKVGAGTTEDTFHAGDGPGGQVVTKEQATAKLAELQADKAWCARLTSGDVATVREWNALEQLRAA